MTQKQNLREETPLHHYSSMETGLVDTAYPDDHFSFLFRPFDAVSYLPQLGNISAGNKLRINT